MPIRLLQPSLQRASLLSQRQSIPLSLKGLLSCPTIASSSLYKQLHTHLIFLSFLPHLLTFNWIKIAHPFPPTPTAILPPLAMLFGKPWKSQPQHIRRAPGWRRLFRAKLEFAPPRFHCCLGMCRHRLLWNGALYASARAPPPTLPCTLRGECAPTCIAPNGAVSLHQRPLSLSLSLARGTRGSVSRTVLSRHIICSA